MNSVCSLVLLSDLVVSKIRYKPHGTRERNTRKSSPVTGLEWPREFQESKVPRFHDDTKCW
jgi:hypothetical protein